MRENVKIQFYKISKCGYYSYHADKPEFGNVSELLHDLL